MIKAHALRWVQSFVIDLNLCPFARRVVEQQSLAIEAMYPEDTAAGLLAFKHELDRLDNDQTVETVLLVCGSRLLDDFEFYLDFCALAEKLMHDQGYTGVYQMATFHPNYCFAGVRADDPGNYTNRSPDPMLHILRESSLDQAIKFYGCTEHIPRDNIKNMHRMGIKKIQQLAASIYSSTRPNGF